MVCPNTVSPKNHVIFSVGFFRTETSQECVCRVIAAISVPSLEFAVFALQLKLQFNILFSFKQNMLTFYKKTYFTVCLS